MHQALKRENVEVTTASQTIVKTCSSSIVEQHFKTLNFFIFFFIVSLFGPESGAGQK
jgi:hypothetical protein